MDDEDALMRVTPKTVSAYARLTQRLWTSGEWSDVLTCLNTAIRILTKEEPEGRPDEPLALVSGEIRRAHDREQDPPEEIIRSLSQQRCTVLGILGDWRERTLEVSRYSRLVRDCVARRIREARELGERGRHDDSLSLYFEILDQDWKNTQALIEAARLAARPGAGDRTPPWNRPVDLLFRVVINSESLDEGMVETVFDILDPLSLSRSEDLLLADLIRGAALVLNGRLTEGIALLEGLTRRITDVGEVWRQRHLAWYYLGRGYEAAGQAEEAREAYGRVIREVPTHLESLRRLAALESADPVESAGRTDVVSRTDSSGENDSACGADAVGRTDSARLEERIRALTPQVPCNVNFGGKVVLLGLDFSRGESEGGAGEAWYITYYWQFRDRMYEGYHPLVHFCGKDWRILFQDDHQPRALDRPYPVDLPRSGEVVVEKRRLQQDPATASYLRIGIATATPRDFAPQNLTCDGGGDFFLTRLQNVDGRMGAAH
jgi:tetratricopeptide (TPR) repeat protein